MTKRQSLEAEDAKKTLRELLPPGSTVLCILRSVSRSGMSREISFLTKDHQNVTGLFALVGDYRRGKRDGLTVSGCGMDMGFAVVYDVSRRLYPGGFGIEGEGPLGHEIRPGTKDHAAQAVKMGVKFYGRNGDSSGWDNDGGYALSHRWI
jgi:hypothetical protein